MHSFTPGPREKPPSPTILFALYGLHLCLVPEPSFHLLRQGLSLFKHYAKAPISKPRALNPPHHLQWCWVLWSTLWRQPSTSTTTSAHPPPLLFGLGGPLIKLKSSPSCILERWEDFPSPTLLSQRRCYRRVTPFHCTASWRGRECVFNLRLPESDHKCKKTAPSPLPLSDLFAWTIFLINDSISWVVLMVWFSSPLC